MDMYETVQMFDAVYSFWHALRLLEHVPVDKRATGIHTCKNRLKVIAFRVHIPLTEEAPWEKGLVRHQYIPSAHNSALSKSWFFYSY